MQPVLFTLPGLDWEVQAYGFFMGLALVLGWLVSLTLARRDKLPADKLGFVYVVSVALGLLGGRGAWLFQHPEAYQDWRALVVLQAGTIAPFAAILVGLGVSGVMVTNRKIPFIAWYDAATPAFAIGLVLERLGAFFAGSGFGSYAPDFALALRFPEGSPAFVHHQRTLAQLMPAGATESLPVHPTQLYGVVLGLGGIALCYFLLKRRKFSGQIIAGYLIYLMITRSFIEEWFRYDASTSVLGPLNPGQAIAAVLVLTLGVVYWTRLGKAAAGEEGLRLWEGGEWSPKPARKGKGVKKKSKKKAKKKAKKATAGEPGKPSKAKPAAAEKAAKAEPPGDGDAAKTKPSDDEAVADASPPKDEAPNETARDDNAPSDDTDSGDDKGDAGER